MISKRPWFAPKEYMGWGWRPVSWQGWLVTAAFIAAVGTGAARFGASIGAVAIGAVSLAAFVGVILLTGARPGGRDRD